MRSYFLGVNSVREMDMKTRISLLGRLLIIMALFCSAASSTHASTNAAVKTADQSNAASLPSRFCTLPTVKAGSAEETAWQIFVAINCSQNGRLAWENWTEQTCIINPSTPGCGDASTKKRFLHASQLNAKRHGSDPSNRLGGDCNAMTTVAGSNPASPTLVPFVPKNLAANAQFCEEVFVNQIEASFITNPPNAAKGVNLQTLTGQAAYIKSNGPLQFPKGAIELKIDWLPADAISKTAPKSQSFDCDKNKPQGVYTEVIEGKCYALVGIHISSKLYPKWLWATFEPQNSITNPNRCNPKLYSSCNDAWGSNPAISTGKATAATKNLTNLMDQAGLAAAFRNYRLVGTQTEYDQPKGSLGMGNSFVEFNAGVPAQQSSCVTCHSYAMIDVSKKPPLGNPNFGAFPGTSPIGKPGQPPAGEWKSQDFSWLLGIMPQGK
jgi:hypothetical protein